MKKEKVIKEYLTVTTIFYTHGGAIDYEGITLRSFSEWLEEHNKVRIEENCDCDSEELKDTGEHNCFAIDDEDDFTVYRENITLDDFNKYKGQEK